MIRLAFVGSSFIADRLMNGLKLVEGWQLTACYSRDAVRAAENAVRWGAEHSYGDWEAFCKADCYDAAYVATPNICHFEQTRDLLCSGKHVLLEKPATLTAAEFAELMKTAEQHGVCLMEAMRPMHLPDLPLIEAAMERLGVIRYADFPYCQYSSRYDKYRVGIVENAFKPELAGGALMDIGCYAVSWMERLLGMPKTLRADTIYLPGGIDAVTTLMAAYENCIAVVSGSKVHQSIRPCVIEGEKGTLTLSPFPMPNKMRLELRDGTVEEQPIRCCAADMCYEAEDFLALCRGERDGADDLRHSLHVMRLMDEARRQTGIDFTREQSEKAHREEMLWR
ncbi:MAG: Gfo/Idh/MocA family oxidoreductase [Clostridia bacterium]|nr:Gfo/Idh/MocA family oxidoreductase [Clostridia bacterium]